MASASSMRHSARRLVIPASTRRKMSPQIPLVGHSRLSPVHMQQQHLQRPSCEDPSSQVREMRHQVPAQQAYLAAKQFLRGQQVPAAQRPALQTWSHHNQAPTQSPSLLQQNLPGQRLPGDRKRITDCCASPQARLMSSSADPGPSVARLESRGVVGIDGRDAINFLQGLVTNDMAMFSSDTPPIMEPFLTPNQPLGFFPPRYAAVLSPQGRMLFDVFFYKHPAAYASEWLDKTGSGPASPPADSHSPLLLADVDAEGIDEFLSHLKRHRLRAKVNFEDLSSSLSVWAEFGGPLSHALNGLSSSDPSSSSTPSSSTSSSTPSPRHNSSAPSVADEAGAVGWEGSSDVLGQLSAEATVEGWRWFEDPRLLALGMRGLFPADEVPPLVEADTVVPESEYNIWRYKWGVAEGRSEIPKGDALPLEFNLAGLNAICFHKGCYVGQELTARTHHRGVVRKRVMPVQVAAEGGTASVVQPGVDIIDASSGKKVGKLLALQGGHGVAHLRLAAGLSGKKLAAEGGEGRFEVLPVRPGWWPSEWGREEP